MCTRCQQEKPLTDFSKDKRQRYGHRPECKVCEHQRPSYLLKSLRTRLTAPKLQRWYAHIKNELTAVDIGEMKRVCYFCNEPIVDGASLHRLDHSKDYTVKNTVMVHKGCHAVFGEHNRGPRKKE